MDSKVLGYIFKELRYQRGLTLRQVSERIDIDYSYLSKIETGVLAIQQHQFVALARFYGIKKEVVNRECETFFPDLKRVLNANLQHRKNREKLSLLFLKKYDYLRISQYLPYLHFVELENLSYTGKKEERFYYLIDTLTPRVLCSPYNFFFLLRKLYWASQQHNNSDILKYIPMVESQLQEIKNPYRVFGYFYLFGGYVISGDCVKITRLYDLSHKGFIKYGYSHFAMLSDTTYGAYLVISRAYAYSVKFNKDLLSTSEYELSNSSKKSINFNIAEAYLQLEEIPNALIYYTKSFDILPQKNTTFFISYCLFRVGKIDDAIKNIDETSELGGLNPLFSNLLTWFKKYLAKGRKDKYIKQLEDIEAKYSTLLDHCLRTTLLKIKIEHYQKNKNLEKENIYLREMVKELQSS